MTPSKIKDDSVEDWSEIPSKVVHRRRFLLKEGSAEGRWKDPPKEEVCFGDKDEGGRGRLLGGRQRNSPKGGSSEENPSAPPNGGSVEGRFRGSPKEFSSDGRPKEGFSKRRRIPKPR